MKKLILIALLIGLTAGLAGAQTPTPTPTPPQAKGKMQPQGKVTQPGSGEAPAVVAPNPRAPQMPNGAGPMLTDTDKFNGQVLQLEQENLELRKQILDLRKGSLQQKVQQQNPNYHWQKDAQGNESFVPNPPPPAKTGPAAAPPAAPAATPDALPAKNP